MIYCSKENGNYVDQEEKCMLCTFYNRDTDSCWYEDWYPGLKSGRDLKKKNDY